MTRIELETIIRAPLKFVSIFPVVLNFTRFQWHQQRKSNPWRLTGLCEKGDTIVWRAKHFGIYQRLTVEITDMIVPIFFEDRMAEGIFKSIRHRHFFLIIRTMPG